VASDLAIVTVLALLVALPQIVATARVADFAFRSVHGLPAAETAIGALRWPRFLELVLPLPWGWPSALGRFGFWSDAVTPGPPFIYSLHVGIVAAWLAITSLSSRRWWAMIAIGSLVLAWAGGLSGGVTSALTFGLFRYPQKLLVLWTIAAALLAGWGLDQVRTGLARERQRAALAMTSGGGALFLLAALCHFAHRRVADFLQAHFGAGSHPLLADTAVALWTIGLALGGAVLLFSSWAVARGNATAVVALQGLSLLALAPVVPTDASAPYSGAPPFFAQLGERPRIVVLPALEPPWEQAASHRFGEAGMVGATRLAWQNLEPGFGVPLGLSYPVVPDVEGLASPLVTDGMVAAARRTVGNTRRPRTGRGP
jgi:hypothetical protein